MDVAVTSLPIDPEMSFVTASYALLAAVPGPDVIALTGLPVSIVFRCPKDCLHLVTRQGIPRSHWQIRNISLM